MKRFVEGQDRRQSALFPECLEDWVGEDNPVRVIDAFVEGLDLANLRFIGVDPEATGRPAYHPAVLLKLYVYGYLSRVQSGLRLEREAERNTEVMWLPDRRVSSYAFFNFIGRTDNQHSEASGVAFAYAGTSLCGTSTVPRRITMWPGRSSQCTGCYGYR